MGKRLEYFIKEDERMANKHMQRSSTCQTFQIGCHYTPARMLIIRANKAIFARMQSNQSSYMLLVRILNGATTLAGSFQIKINHMNNSNLTDFPKEMKTSQQQKLIYECL